jgi:hypothetical protein
VMQMEEGQVSAIESDRAITATIGDRTMQLQPFTPSYLRGEKGK